MEVPYISQIHVNNCYTHRNLDIPTSPLSDFKHIILTGKNGSGKTTILRSLALQLYEYNRGKSIIQTRNIIGNQIKHARDHSNLENWKKQLADLENLDVSFLDGSDEKLISDSLNFVVAFFRAHRRIEFKQVSTVTKESVFIDELKRQSNTSEFASQFKQYLVNKKVYEAFDFMNSRSESINQNRLFFEKLVSIFQRVFNDNSLRLEFVQEAFEFLIILGDGRTMTFNQLSEGFSAFISILMELMMRVDLIRKTNEDYTLNPYGIVLIDEPETHFHIEMQYEILPLLSEVFPNMQFIIATHSPAIISSLTNAIVYDLSSRKEIKGSQVGSSFSELMVKHFGLDNEFSPVADKIIEKIKIATRTNNTELLRDTLIEFEQYLTPSLRFEIDNQIIAIESQRVNNND